MICFESESLVCLYGIESLVLQFIGTKLGDQADATALFLFIKQNSRSRLGDHLQRELKLLATVATQ